jgi:adenylosuccinate lyase
MHGIENGITFERSLMENDRVRNALTADELKAALDPAKYLGHAETIVDRVLKEQNAGWLAA